MPRRVLGVRPGFPRGPHGDDANTAAVWADLPRLADDVTRLADAG